MEEKLDLLRIKPVRILCQSRHEIMWLLYLISLVLQQGLQLLAQHQGAEVRYGHGLRVRPFGSHAILTNEHTHHHFHSTAAVVSAIFKQNWVSVLWLRITDRHLLQAAGQAGGGDTVSGSLRVVQTLQRSTDTVAACQWRPAAFLVLPCCLVLQETQGVRLHGFRNQTRNTKSKGLRRWNWASI